MNSGEKNEYSIKYTKKKQRNRTTPTPISLFTKKTVVNDNSLDYSVAENDDRDLILFTKSAPATSLPSSTLLSSLNSSPKLLSKYSFFFKFNTFLLLIHELVV